MEELISSRIRELRPLVDSDDERSGIARVLEVECPKIGEEIGKRFSGMQNHLGQASHMSVYQQ